MRLGLILIQRARMNSHAPVRATPAPAVTPSAPATLQKTSAALAALAVVGSIDAQTSTPTAAPATTKLADVVVEGQRQPQVSSPKFTEPLRDTPQTVVVIPSEVYTQQGATNLSEALRNTPGITFTAGEGGGASSTAGDAFYMRGFDTTNNIFVDGVRDVGAYSRDVFNIEQVEVAKGPAGTDVGRSASSGFINLSTKTPRREEFTTSQLTFGLDDGANGHRQRATLDTNQALADSPVKGTAFRLNAMWQDSDAVGREGAENKSWAIAPSLALGLGTPTRAYFTYQHLEQNNRPDYGLPGALHPGYVSTPQPPAVDRSTYYGHNADFDDVTSEAVMARLEHDFSDNLRVSNQTRFSSNQREAVVTTPGTSINSYAPATGLLTRSRQGNKRDTDILSNLTNLGANLTTGKIEHSISAGAELTRENAYSPSFTSATLTPIPIASPNPAATPSGSPVRSGAYTDVGIDTVGLYAFDTVKFNEHIQLNGGLRWDKYDVDYLSVATTGIPTRLTTSKDITTYKIGAVYKPLPAGSIYASYAVSQKPPGTDFTLSSTAGNQNNPDTDPQETTNVELGVKWDFFQGRLSTTAALFKTENDKTIYTDPILGAIPAGRQTVQGLELGASGKITDDWLVFAGFSYLDSEIDAGTAAQMSFGLPLIAKVSGNVWTTYRIGKFTLGGGAQYQGEANRLQNTAGAPVTMPAYWLLNAVASYDVNDHVSLRLNVNNLADEEYTASYNNNGGRFMPGAPRAYLLTATLKF